MVDISDFARRIRRRTITAGVLFLSGAFMLVVDFTTRFPTAEKGEFALAWAFVMGVGGYFWYRSMELPGKEIIQLAEQRGGLLTVTEITTALDINPDTAKSALSYLQSQGLAKPCWEELEKNLWEFPDCTRLPIVQAVQFAQHHSGRITLQDLVAAGHSLEIAQQTLSVLQTKGLVSDSVESSDLESPRGEVAEQ